MPLSPLPRIACREPSPAQAPAPDARPVPVHTITVHGTDQSFQCAEDDTLLGAALRAGLGHPYECSSGGCGSCVFDVVKGEVEDHWSAAPGLSPRSRAKGRRLACQCSPRGDCTVSVRLRSAFVPTVRPERRKARLLSIRHLTADMALFSFHADGRADFRPGQYAILRLPGIEGGRVYSMCNLANAHGRWEFIIKRVPGGSGTGILFEQARPGDELELDGPYGMAHLVPDTGRDIVCIGGGSGLSPLISILAGAARDASLSDRSLRLFYGARTPADICADTLLSEDATTGARVRLEMAISEPGPATWSGARGFIHDVVAQWFATGVDPKIHDFYFCGPPAMTTAVQGLLLGAGVPMDQLHYDRFL